MSFIDEQRTYVAGDWVTGAETMAVENPADETQVAELAATPLDQIERAVLEARRSFDDGVWSGLSAAKRVGILHAFIDHIESRKDDLIDTVIAESGQLRAYAEGVQYAMSIAQGRDYLDLYSSLPEDEHNPVPIDELLRGRVAVSLRRYEPIGVVSAITPYNAAIIMGFQKLIPALVSGNSVVLRPSPFTPVSSLVFAAAADAAGLPPGVLSVVAEEGAEGAELLTSHPAVDMVSFTGSTAVGRRIVAQAAPTLKRVGLELGGKSAQIYLDDAIDKTPNGAMQVVAMTAGQACVAATRMLVPADRKAEVLEMVAGAYGQLKVGPPDDSTAMVGPLINAGARERCQRIVAHAEQEGAKVICGGRRPANLDRGYYFEPTVLDVPDNANPGAQEEIFGPVLSVIGYEDVDDAVRIANDTVYGLSGQVYGNDAAAATAVARRLRTGAVNVNTALTSAYAPSGGYKQSGLGRERGPEGIRAFQEVKHLAIGELK